MKSMEFPWNPWKEGLENWCGGWACMHGTWPGWGAHSRPLWWCIYVCMYIHMSICIQVYMYICVYILCMYILTHLWCAYVHRLFKLIWTWYLCPADPVGAGAGHVLRIRASSSKSINICNDMSMDVSMDMSKYILLGTSICVSIDTSMDTSMDMSADMCMDVGINTYIYIYIYIHTWELGMFWGCGH